MIAVNILNHKGDVLVQSNAIRINKFGENKKEVALTIISAVIAVIGFFTIWRLCETTELIYIDDVMYADWTRHDINHFLNRSQFIGIPLMEEP